METTISRSSDEAVVMDDDDQMRIEARVSREAEDAIDESEARYREQLSACDLDDVLGVTKENE